MTATRPSVTAPTRVGLTGINARARRLLIPGLMASPRAQLTAVCSRNGMKARATADELSRQSGTQVGAFGSLHQLVTSGRIDAIYVNTPLEAHVEMCRAAIRAGCSVICEKPLAPSAAEAEELVREAERVGVRTVVNFTYRSVPGLRLTERWLIESGGIGTPLHARFELLQGHNFLPDFRLGSALLDSGCHLFDLMAALLDASGFGQVTAVRGEALSANRPDYGWAFHTLTERGVVVSALFSRSALGWRNGLRWTLAGDERVIEVETDGAHLAARTAERGDGMPFGTWRALELPIDLAADDARFPAFHLDRLVGAVRGEEDFPGFAEALFTNRLAEALELSAQEERWDVI